MNGNCFYLLSIYLIYFKFIHIVQTSEVRLESVTKFQGLGELYQSMRGEGRIRRRELDIITKNQICRYIFNSPHFKHNCREVYVDVMEKSVRKTLQKKHEPIFNQLYHSPQFRAFRKKLYVHINPDENRVVAVNAGTYEESVFICLTKSTLSNSIASKYFVSSNAYNLNRFTNTHGINEFIAGRFVFAEGFYDRLILDVLAERSGSPFVRGSAEVEKFYRQKRENRGPATERDNDPLCSLTDAEKLRLCAIVMGSEELRHEFQFEPQDIFVDRTCVRRVISFRTAPGLEVPADTVFEEWAISCKPRNLNTNQYEVLYVSRGYAANCAFIYQPIYEILFLHHFVNNVSVLPD